MNVPAIAKQTFESLRNQPAFLAISHFIIEHLNKIKSSTERARFVHNVIDEYNKEVFAHPILKELVPCKTGCTACCHTQVSVTDDEAALLIANIDGGVEIDYKLLEKQAAAGNDPVLFFNIPYKDRKCIFLDSAGGCRVYEDRPSVCRTNAVVGDASQCDTSTNQPASLRLVKTSKADMAIFGAFYNAKESGTLPMMIAKLLKEKFAGMNTKKIQKPVSRTRNSISKDHEL
jgi:Fe-S-cluster containining protein